MKLNNNTILITGGTSGIGLALAKKLDELGNQIIVLGRNAKRLEYAKQTNPNFATYQADVSKPDSLSDLQEWITINYPKLNMVINSAGTMQAYDLFDPEVSPSDLITDIQTNLIGTITIDKLLLNQLINQPESLILNVSSGLANLSSAAHPTYSASKAGVHMFTDALREQILFTQRNHVHVMELVPPLVGETNLEANITSDASGSMRLVDLVDVTIKGIASNKIRVNAGYAKLMRKAGQIAPDRAEHQLAKNMLPQYFPNGLH